MKNDKKSGNGFVKFLAFIGVLAIIGGIAYAIYRYLTPEYLEDSDDDLDDDFDDFFEDEDEFDPLDEDDVDEKIVTDTFTDVKEEAEEAAEEVKEAAEEAAEDIKEAVEDAAE